MTLLDRLESLRREHDEDCVYGRRISVVDCFCGASTHNATLDDCIREVESLQAEPLVIVRRLSSIAHSARRALAEDAVTMRREVDGWLQDIEAEVLALARLQRSSTPAACASSISSKESHPTTTDAEDPPPPEAPT